MNEPIPHPFLLNTWKHHAGWIRWRMCQAVTAGPAEVDTLPTELAVVGTRLMDLYTGSCTPAGIAAHIGDELTASRAANVPFGR